MKKRTKIILAIFVVAAIVLFIIKTVANSKKNDTEVNDIPAPTAVTTTATTLSEEDISAMVSQMVESQVAEQLAEQANGTTVTPSSESQATTTTPGEESSTEQPASDNSITLVVAHQGREYELNTSSSVYEAAFFSTFLQDNGRDLTFIVDSSITDIRVATSFITEDGEMTQFGDFSDVSFSSVETGNEFSYSIPNNPYDIDYNGKSMCFCAVFRIDTGDGIAYAAISY